MARMKMSRNTALSKMRKLQDTLIKQFYGISHVDYYCDEIRDYENICFRLWLVDNGKPGGGEALEATWSTNNADTFYPRWVAFEKEVMEKISTINNQKPNSNE